MLEGYFEMELNVRGEFNGQKIAPFLLLPFIENFFHNAGPLNTDRWFNMDIEVKKKQFSLKLANGIIDGANDSLERTTTNGLEKVQKRLTLIYPQHELKIYRQQEMLITYLKIQLNVPDLLEVSKVQEPVL